MVEGCLVENHEEHWIPISTFRMEGSKALLTYKKYVFNVEEMKKDYNN